VPSKMRENLVREEMEDGQEKNRATTGRRTEYGGLKLQPARLMKKLEKENSRRFAELSLERQV